MRKFTVHEVERIEALTSEGVPANWISEDMDRSTPTVSEKIRKLEVPGHDEGVREWYRVWAQIRNDPDLLALHRQFAPKHGAH